MAKRIEIQVRVLDVDKVKELMQLSAQVAQWFQTYGFHTPNCGYSNNVDAECTCGYRATQDRAVLEKVQALAEMKATF